MSRLIDADALEREGWSLCRTFQKDKDTMVYEVKKPSDFPPIEERKTGSWIYRHNEEGWGNWYECSECGKTFSYAGNFCSECGAKMRGKK